MYMPPFPKNYLKFHLNGCILFNQMFLQTKNARAFTLAFIFAFFSGTTIFYAKSAARIARAAAVRGTAIAAAIVAITAAVSAVVAITAAASAAVATIAEATTVAGRT